MNTPNERLKRSRIAAGYSSAGDFACAHDFPAVTYRAHESGVRNFKVQSAKAYAAALALPHPSGWRWLMLGDPQDQLLASSNSTEVDSMLAEVSDAYWPTPTSASTPASAPAPASTLVPTPAPSLPPLPAHGEGAKPGCNTGTLTQLGNNAFVQIPVFDVIASAGAGAEPLDGPPVDHLAFSSGALGAISSSALAKLVGISVRGDSMEPTLNHGDQILVDLSSNAPTDDGVYVVRLDSALIVKRLSIDPFRRMVSVLSDNSRYPPIQDLSLDQVEVVGRVIWLGRRM